MFVVKDFLSILPPTLSLSQVSPGQSVCLENSVFSDPNAAPLSVLEPPCTAIAPFPPPSPSSPPPPPPDGSSPSLPPGQETNILFKVSEPDATNTVEVLLTNTVPIAGYQFDVVGFGSTLLTIATAATGPNALPISFSGSKVLGVSFSGEVIPPGADTVWQMGL